MKRRVLIADDEPLARQRVRRLLRAEPDALVVGEAADGAATVEEIRRLAPEVLFLDVEMPGLDGFEALAEIPEPERPVIVFVTAFAEYAVPAFDTAAADYVLKPLDARRFSRAWERARTRLAERAAASGGSRPRAPYLQRFLVARGEGLRVLPASEVRWLEAQDNYVALHTAAGVHLVRSSLSALEARLDPAVFARIRRTTLVNCSLVHELRRGPADEWKAVLRTGEELRIGATHRALFLRRLRGAGPDGGGDGPPPSSRSAGRRAFLLPLATAFLAAAASAAAEARPFRLLRDSVAQRAAVAGVLAPRVRWDAGGSARGPASPLSLNRAGPSHGRVPASLHDALERLR